MLFICFTWLCAIDIKDEVTDKVKIWKQFESVGIYLKVLKSFINVLCNYTD